MNQDDLNWELSEQINGLEGEPMSHADFNDMFQEEFVSKIMDRKVISILPYDMHRLDAIRMLNRVIEYLNLSMLQEKQDMASHLKHHYDANMEIEGGESEAGFDD